MKKQANKVLNVSDKIVFTGGGGFGGGGHQGEISCEWLMNIIK